MLACYGIAKENTGEAEDYEELEGLYFLFSNIL